MFLSGHLEVADFIKNVHEELREKAKLVGVEKAWEEHCADSGKLEKYAQAMKKLATNHWKKTNKDCSRDASRITWVYEACMDYFKKEIFNIRLKECEVANKINKDVECLFNNSLSTNWRLLDVGSCYNPFKYFDAFDVTAIDIAPAVKGVYKCDYLHVQLTQNLKLENDEVKELPENYFDVIVFSLFIGYLPSPLLRKLACKKAYNLLKLEGILLIVTPDSNHVGTNAKYMKSWRFVLANMGFSRIKYEKLKHIHCMVFRKSLLEDISIRWARIHEKEQVFDEIYIPQDFKHKNEKITSISPRKFDIKDIMEIDKELPFSDVFE